MDDKRPFRSRQCVRALVMLACLLLVTLPVWASYEIERPVTEGGGKINQHNLYGEEHGYGPHKGVDFPALLHTPVYAVADGVVVQLRENVQNGEGSGYGNFVLIRHDRQSWDRVSGRDAWVYTVYAHLAQWSVVPATGHHVLAGQHIAGVDDTGTSTGNHLHFQICLDPAQRDSLGSWCSERSRNPEVWLQPYSYDANTAAVAGALTDANGNPIADWYRIYGLEKPYAENGDYGWNVVYSAQYINPDDTLVENWATTDVTAADNYHLQATDGSGVFFRDLGYHNVRQGEITYVDLYPFYLPDVRSGAGLGGWSSYTAIRNNDASDRAQVNTTTFKETGAGVVGRTDWISSRSTVIFAPYASYAGSAVLVSTERSAPVVVPQSYDVAYAYVAVPVNSDLTGFQAGADLALSQARSLYMPNFLADYYGWNTELYVQNTGRAPADITVFYYDENGQEVTACRQTFWAVDPWERLEIRTQDCQWLPSFGSVHLLSYGSPLAAITVQHSETGIQTTSSRQSAYNAFSRGNTTLYAPMLLRSFWGWQSGFFVHNLENGSTTLRVRYYQYDGDYICTDTRSLPARGTLSFYQGTMDPNHSCLANYNPGSPEERIFSARLSTENPPRHMIAVVNQERASTNDHQSYNALVQGLNSLVFPWIIHTDWWDSDIAIRNTSAAGTTIDVYFYNQDGTLNRYVGNLTLPGNGAVELYSQVPAGFEGSVVITCPQPIAGNANLMRTDISDGGVSYPGVAEQ